MAQLGDLANLAEIVSGLFVVGGLLFALYEVRQTREEHKRQEALRKRDGAFELFHSLGTKEFVTGINILYEMPEGLSKEEVESRYPEDIDNLRWILFQFENLGTMVHNGSLDIDLVEEFFPVSAINAWTKLAGYITELRKKTGKPNLYIFVQRLAEEMLRRDPDRIGMEAA